MKRTSLLIIILILSLSGFTQVITDTVLNNNRVIIGGNVKITGGNPGVGKVLTSDAVGNAAWAVPAASAASLPPNVVYLSQLGILSDANLGMTSTTFGTDQTVPIQNILNTANNGGKPLIVYWDVKCSVAGLNLESNTTIIGLPGCGAILRNSSPYSIFTNITQNNAMVSRQDSNIVIDGGVWNGNNQGNDLYATPGSLGVPLTCMNFIGVEKLTIKNTELINSPSFSMLLANVQYVTMENNILDQGLSGAGPFYGSDGIHINGPARFVYINNTQVKNVSDDCIAINADEVPTTSNFSYLGAPLGGDIFDVQVRNTRLGPNARYGFSMYSTAKRLDRVLIDGVTGNSTTCIAVINNLHGLPSQYPGDGNVGAVTIRNIDVIVQGQIGVRSAEFIIGCIADRILIENYRRDSWTDPFRMVKVEAPGNVKELSLSNISAYKATPGFSTPLIEVTAGNVDLLRIDGAVINGLDKLFQLTGGTVGEVLASNISHRNSGGYATFNTSVTIPKITLSNYSGAVITAGTFTATGGDAFASAVDITAPAVASYSATTATNIRLVFNEAMGSVTIAGHTFSNGGTITPTSVTQINSTTYDFTVSGLAYGQAITHSYNQTSGATVDVAGNELVAITNATVTNNIAGGANILTMPGGTLTASNSYSGSDILNTIDGSNATKWNGNPVFPQYITFDAGSGNTRTPVRLGFKTLATGDGNFESLRESRSFTVRGSNVADFSTSTTLLTVTNNAYTSDVIKYFDFTTTGSFRYFSITINSLQSGSDNIPQITELYLIQ